MLKLTRGSARELVDRDEAERLKRARVLVRDDRKQRPFWFDGRFLAARDLTREQTYFLTRQADLGRAGGAGVVRGLWVQPGDAQTVIEITPGHGVTLQGEMVVLTKPLVLSTVDVPRMRTLDVAFGLSRLPRLPMRNLTGLFIVALRPVEYTANPIASYPVSITGTRSTHDGDIVEAVAATLIPYSNTGDVRALDLGRAQVARQIFLDGGRRELPEAILPLAMVALSRGVVQWIDQFMVRREVGAEHGDVLGLGFAPRAMREAYLLQHERHLEEILEQRAGRGMRFPASEYFAALPPAGRMPAAAIDPRDFTQIYFPPEVDVDLSLVPQDELAALVEESLFLPPIDLTLNEDELESTSVLVLIPVARRSLRSMSARLKNLQRALRPAAPGLVVRRKPLESLRLLKQPRLASIIAPAESVVDAAWRRALASTEMLWYVRRRNLAYKAEVVGARVDVFRNELDDERNLTDRLRTLDLMRRFTNLKRRGSAEADAEMVGMLMSGKFEISKTLVDGAMRELEATKRMDRVSVLSVAGRFAHEKLGEGLQRLEATNPELKTAEPVARNLAKSLAVPELDRLGVLVDDEALPALATELEEVARTRPPKEVAAFVKERLKEVER